MSKTIEEQVEETVIDLTQHIQSIDGVALDELIDNIRTALQERERIARNEAIKECAGCVPNELTEETKEEYLKNNQLNASDYELAIISNGHNSCREQTLQEIRQLAYNHTL